MVVKMSHFILEIGTEELPARFLSSVEKELIARFTEKLAEENLGFESILVHNTPRRSILHIHGLAKAQPLSEELVLGPAVGIAYDAENQLTKAGLGFIKSQNADMNSVFRQKTEKGEYIAVQKQIGGKPSSEVLAKICPLIINALPFPKKMRWGSKTFAFARPLHWILALLDSEIVNFSIENIHSSNMTYGHRIHGIGPFTINHADDLEKVLLEQSQIICSANERREIIIAEADALAKDLNNSKIIWKGSLLNEVQGLVEKPVPIIGSFDEDFLELPAEVLLTSMEHHQKCFGLIDENDKLLAKFLTVLNLEPENRDVVRKGWEKVLRARLEDARFYWNEDLKDGFDKWIEMLDRVIFLGPLGSMGEKSRRIAKLTAWLVEKLEIKSGENAETKELAEQIGLYAKADLMSKMVGEFDTLQGIMGGIYAKRAGFSTEFSTAIQEQYLPTGPDSLLPSTDFGACLAMADKVDTLVGCFGLGNIPTGTADPYALRRAALGISRIMMGFAYQIPLSEIFVKAYELYSEDINWKHGKQNTLAKLQEFCSARLKNLFVSTGAETLVADAIINAKDENSNDLSDLIYASSKRLEALKNAQMQSSFTEIAQTLKRVNNILTKAKAKLDGIYDISLFEAECEHNLHQAIKSFSVDFDNYYGENNFNEIMPLMASLKPYVDSFFEEVMVMAEDEKVQYNRMNLLYAISSRMQKLADFSLLQI